MPGSELYSFLRGLSDDTEAMANYRASASGMRPPGPVAELEARFERALLMCEAMWTILREKLGVTDLELLQRINDLDLSDGQLDGKARKGAVACPKCGRTIARRLPKCMYCGQAIMHDPFV